MCEKLSSEDILLNYFHLNEKKKKISLSSLGKLSQKIAAVCGLSVIVKYSYQDIAEALQHNHRCITLEGDYIKRCSDEPIMLTNYGIPAHVKQVMRNILSTQPRKR